MKIKRKLTKLITCMMLMLMLTMQLACISSAETINKLFIEAGEDIVKEDDIFGNAIICGRGIEINNIIDGIALIAGQEVTLKGKVLFPFAAAQNIIVDTVLEKDLFAAAQNIRIKRDATISRDAYIAGSNVIIDGQINRDLYVACDSLKVTGGAIINGNIYTKASSIIIDENAIVTGKVKYNDNAKTSINVEKVKLETYHMESSEENQASRQREFDVFGLLRKIVGYILVFSAMMALSGRFFSKLEDKYDDIKIIFLHFIIGAGLIVLIPMISILLLITGYGASLGLIALALYAIAIYMSLIVASYIFASMIAKKAFKKDINRYLIGIAGVIVFSILTVVPFVSIFLTLLGFGAVIMTAIKK